MNVEPIRDINAVENIKKILNGNVRDRLLFVLGINNGLRIGDILKLKVSQLQGLKIGDTLPIVEEKTGKQNVMMVNKSVFKVSKSTSTHTSRILTRMCSFHARVGGI